MSGQPRWPFADASESVSDEVENAACEIPNGTAWADMEASVSHTPAAIAEHTTILALKLARRMRPLLSGEGQCRKLF